MPFLLSKLLPAQPIFHRRRHLRRIAELREADNQAQVARKRRLQHHAPAHTQKTAGTHHVKPQPAVVQHAMRQTAARPAPSQPALSFVQATPSVTPVVQSAMPLPAIKQPATGRGSYVNYTSRRAQQFSRG